MLTEEMGTKPAQINDLEFNPVDFLGAERFLILAPGKHLDKWPNAIRRWSKIHPWPTISVVNRGLRGIPPSSLINYTIVSWAVARQEYIANALRTQSYEVVLFDNPPSTLREALWKGTPQFWQLDSERVEEFLTKYGHPLSGNSR